MDTIKRNLKKAIPNKGFGDQSLINVSNENS